MHQLYGNCLIGQSGGPTCAINASLCGIIEEAFSSDLIKDVYGAINGIEGFLKRNIVDIRMLLKTQKDFELLKTTPAAFLGSCRYKLPPYDTDSHTYEKIFSIFKELNIRYFFYIGGNDSMDTVMKLSDYAKEINYPIHIIGVPKTIDNDLVGTDHTPGFGSAAKLIATSILEISYDINVYNTKSVTIIEIMGRNSGWLTAASALSRCQINQGPDLIYLPEVSFSIEQFIKDIQKIQKNKGNVIVAISEGIRDASGKYICDIVSQGATDPFGHSNLGGAGKVLENIVKSSLHCKVRSIELNILQRCAMHISSQTDLNEAYQIGREAVKASLKDHTGIMVGFKRETSPNYHVSVHCVDVRKVANHEKKVPREWINESGNDIMPQLVEYIKPLIIGEPALTISNGLPVYLMLNSQALPLVENMI